MRKFLYFICISIFISLIFNILTTIELYKTKVEFKSFKKHLLENGLKNYKITGNKEFAQKSHQQAKILLDKREFSSHEHYKKGMDFFQKANWEKATYHFEQAATQGHQGALEMLKECDNVSKYNIP